jgi:hypothetical protein
MFGKKKSLLDQATEMVAESAPVDAGEEIVKGGGKKKWLLALSLLILTGLVGRKLLKNNAEANAWQSNYKPTGN